MRAPTSLTANIATHDTQRTSSGYSAERFVEWWRKLDRSEQSSRTSFRSCTIVYVICSTLYLPHMYAFYIMRAYVEISDVSVAHTPREGRLVINNIIRLRFVFTLNAPFSRPALRLSCMPGSSDRLSQDVRKYFRLVAVRAVGNHSNRPAATSSSCRCAKSTNVA